MAESGNLDLVHSAILSVAGHDPVLGFVLFVSWHVALYDVIPDKLGSLRGTVENKVSGFEERERPGWRQRVVGGMLWPVKASTGLLPEPPDDIAERAELLEVLEGDYDELEEHLQQFLRGDYEVEELTDELKEALDADSSAEAFDLYVDIKDLVVDREMFREFDRLFERVDELDPLAEETKAVLSERRGDITAEVDAFRDDVETSFRELRRELADAENRILAFDEGFELLTRLRFDGDEPRFEERWLEGWDLDLVDVYHDLDYRRPMVEEVVDGGNYLLRGPPGHSKSTTLKRIMVDWYEAGGEVLYNVESGRGGITAPIKVVEVLRRQLRDSTGDLLVAIDDVHNPERVAALSLPRMLERRTDPKTFDRASFVFTARTPDFERPQLFANLDDDLRVDVDETRERLLDAERSLGTFDRGEAADFVEKYRAVAGGDLGVDASTDVGELYSRSQDGHPVLLKFLLIGKGLDHHVATLYDRYVWGDERERYGTLEAAVLVCLLDWSGVTITDEVVEGSDVPRRRLRELDGWLLKRDDRAGAWDAIGPRWDVEFFGQIAERRRNSVWVERSRSGLVRDVVAAVDSPALRVELLTGMSTAVLEDAALFDLFEEALVGWGLPHVACSVVPRRRKALFFDQLRYMFADVEDDGRFLRAYDRALDRIDPATVGDFEMARLHLGRGQAHEATGDPERAIDDFSAAIDYDGSLEGAYHRRAQAHMAVDDYPAAVRDYDELVGSDPHNPRLRVLRAHARRQLGEHAGYVRDLADAGFLYWLRSDGDGRDVGQACERLSVAFEESGPENAAGNDAGVALAAIARIGPDDAPSAGGGLRTPPAEMLSRARESDVELSDAGRALLRALSGEDVDFDGGESLRERAVADLITRPRGGRDHRR